MLLISDANVLIDVVAGDIIEETFALHHTLGVPDVLFHYELQTRHSDLPARGLRVMELAPPAVLETLRLLERHAPTGVSNQDCMALALAKQEQCTLLTGDAALRQVALLEGVEVRGTVWLVQEMFDNGLINTGKARNAYDAMRTDGSRLPWGEVDRQLKMMARMPESEK